MAKYKQMGLKERAKQLKSAIEDFKSIEGFSRKVIKKYTDQLNAIEMELEKEKQGGTKSE